MFKHRTQIEESDIDNFYHAKDYENIVHKYNDLKIINEFISDTMKKRISPVVLVDYLRRPYVSDYDMNFRVTFDSHIMAKPSYTLFPDDKGFYHCLPGYTILEVKFFRKIPAWFHKLLLVYNLERVSVSKFVLGMKASGIAVDLS